MKWDVESFGGADTSLSTRDENGVILWVWLGEIFDEFYATHQQNIRIRAYGEGISSPTNWMVA